MSARDCEIRCARPEDIGEIVALCDAHAAFEGASYSVEGKADKLRQCLFEDGHIHCIVLIVSGKISGYATYRPEFSTWDCAFYMHMDCLYLIQQARGKGFGRMMVDVIVAESRKLGCINIQWQTPAANYDAIQFYKKMEAVPREKMRFCLEI